jgi:hypothetical protein
VTGTSPFAPPLAVVSATGISSRKNANSSVDKISTLRVFGTQASPVVIRDDPWESRPIEKKNVANAYIEVDFTAIASVLPVISFVLVHACPHYSKRQMAKAGLREDMNARGFLRWETEFLGWQLKSWTVIPDHG